jgi:hypothetical protein
MSLGNIELRVPMVSYNLISITLIGSWDLRILALSIVHGNNHLHRVIGWTIAKKTEEKHQAYANTKRTNHG